MEMEADATLRGIATRHSGLTGDLKQKEVARG